MKRQDREERKKRCFKHTIKVTSKCNLDGTQEYIVNRKKRVYEVEGKNRSQV